MLLASGVMLYETRCSCSACCAAGHQHAVASLCLQLTRELDAARIVTTACIAAVADVAMRTRAADTPSSSLIITADVGGWTAPFGVDHHLGLTRL